MATKVIAWNTGSGNITLTYQGQGNGPITVQSDDNDIGTARSQTITVETVGGAIVKNLTVSQGACPFPVGDVKNYSYVGDKQTVLLPAGTYKLQCWGAQGGSNETNSTYGITAKAGGKGGYSEGVLTLSSPTEMEINVGGQGLSSAGGFNGGGSTTGTSSYSTGTSGHAGYEFGYSKMGGGGGATDIRLKDGGLLSRFIVAGGGSGGAMAYKKETKSSTVTKTPTWGTSPSAPSGAAAKYTTSITSGGISMKKNEANGGGYNGVLNLSSYNFPVTVSFTYTLQGGVSSDFGLWYTPDSDLYLYASGGRAVAFSSGTHTVSYTFTDSSKPYIGFYGNDMSVGTSISITNTRVSYSQTSTTTSNDSQAGFIGGGANGGGYSSIYQGKQDAAGSNGSFGQGANQTATNMRYASGAGGGGWYGGGGGQTSNSTMSYCKYSGGGSGFVNTAASAGNRPLGYTGLELDSGTTIDGAHSFEAPGGGTETGHSGNGYVRITRLS